MKKRTLKNLRLNKRAVSHLRTTEITGGSTNLLKLHAATYLIRLSLEHCPTIDKPDEQEQG
jgi:hypothetical protein